MNATLYVAGKKTGDSGIALHGESTLLVKVPGGFNPETGAKLAPIERGFQRDDLQAARDTAAQHVALVAAALVAAKEVLDAHDALLADADAALSAPASKKARKTAKKRAKKK